jgi:hypothetical protein
MWVGGSAVSVIYRGEGRTSKQTNQQVQASAVSAFQLSAIVGLLGRVVQTTD